MKKDQETSLSCPGLTEADYREYLQSLLDGDRRQCEAMVRSWIDSGMDMRTLYQGPIRQSLYEIGSLWEQNRISVATEHLATAITENLLNLTYPQLFNRPRIGKTALVTCAVNEYHQIGGRMVADLFEWHGWRAHFLGANAPITDLTDMIRQKQVDVVAISLTVYFNFDRLIKACAAIQAACPGVPILCGGQAFRWGGQERIEQIEGTHYLRSLEDLEAWMKSGGAGVEG